MNVLIGIPEVELFQFPSVTLLQIITKCFVVCRRPQTFANGYHQAAPVALPRICGMLLIRVHLRLQLKTQHHNPTLSMLTRASTTDTQYVKKVQVSLLSLEMVHLVALPQKVLAVLVALTWQAAHTASPLWCFQEPNAFAQENPTA